MSANSSTSIYHALVNSYRNRLIGEALERNGGSVGRAAKDLGIHRNMVTRAKRTLGIEVAFRRPARRQSSTEVDRLVAASENLYRLAKLRRA